MHIITVSPEEIREIVRQELQAAMTPLQKSDKEVYLTQREVAALLQCSRPTIIAWGKSGKLRPYKMGKKVFYKRSELFNL